MTGVRWTPTEITLLRSAVKQYGLPSNDAEWGRIGVVVGTRDGKKCKQKWEHLTSTPPPKWTAVRRVEILRRVEAQQGWAQIAREAFNGCDPQAVQNRFRSRPGAGAGGGPSGEPAAGGGGSPVVEDADFAKTADHMLYDGATMDGWSAPMIFKKGSWRQVYRSPKGEEYTCRDAARAAAKQLKGLDADAALPAPLQTPAEKLKAAAKEAKAEEARAAAKAAEEKAAAEKARAEEAAAAKAAKQKAKAEAKAEREAKAAEPWAYLQSSAEEQSRLLSRASAQHAHLNGGARLNEARAVQHAAMQASASDAPGATAAAGNEARKAFLATGDFGIAAQAAAAAEEAAEAREARRKEPAEAAERGDDVAVVERLLRALQGEDAFHREVAAPAALALHSRAEDDPTLLEQLEPMMAEGGVLEHFAYPSRHDLRADVRDRFRGLLDRRRKAAEALQPKAASRALIHAYNAHNPTDLWAADNEYHRFSISDSALPDDDGVGWPMPLRVLFAALMPRLAAAVRGLLDGLDPTVVERARKKAAAAAPEHFKSLPFYETNALEAGERAFRGEAQLNFPCGMDPEARRLHAICRYLRAYDFLTGSLVRIHSVEVPSLVTVVASKVEIDLYLQDAEKVKPTEYVTTFRHAHRLVKAKEYAYALHNSFGPVVFCQQQLMHDSFSLSHPSLELCAKSTVAPNNEDGLLIMAAAGRTLRLSLHRRQTSSTAMPVWWTPTPASAGGPST